MSELGAQKAVLGTFFVVGAVVVYSNLKGTGSPVPPFRTIVALVTLAAGLAIGAGIAPELFGPLTVLIGLAVVLSRVGQPSK